MIVTTAAVSGITTDIIDPIAEQVIRNLLNKLNISEFIKENVYINSDFQASSATQTDENIPILQNNRIDCNINYSLDPSKTKWDINTSKLNIDIGNSLYEIMNLETLFKDSSVRTIIQEHTTPCMIEIECVISCLERTVANNIFNMVINTIGPTRPIFLTNTMHSYFVPEPTILFIGYLYMMSGSNSTQTFEEYIREKSKDRISLAYNQNLTKPRPGWVINRNELEISTELILNDAKPQAMKTNKSTNHYTISFNLGLQFSRPDILFNIFPIIMRNQLVDSVFLPDNLMEKYDIYKSTTHPYIDIENGRKVFDLVKKDELYKMPFYDNFLIPFEPFSLFGFTPFFMGAQPIDTENTVTEVNLSSNLGTEEEPVSIRIEVLDIINNRGGASFNGSLPIVISVYADDVLIDPSTLTFIDNILTIPNRDINKIYRIVLSERKEITDNVQSLRVLKCDLITNN